MSSVTIQKPFSNWNNIKGKMSLAPPTYKYPDGAGVRDYSSIARQAEADQSVQIQKRVNDAFTPVAKKIIATLEMRMRIALEAVGKTVGETMKKEYSAAKGYSRPNSPMTLAYKKGGTPLKETGRLEKAFDSFTVKVFSTGKKGWKVAIGWDMPTAEGSGEFPEKRKGANNNLVYLWAHEYGAWMSTILANKKERVPGAQGSSLGSHGGRYYINGFTIKYRDWMLMPRPFFESGVTKGVSAGRGAIAIAIAQITAELKSANYTNWKLVYNNTSPMPALMPYFGPGMIFYFTPPMKEMAYLGMLSDVRGALQGSLLTEDQILAYVRQMAWGQVGMTRKTQRRKFRRRLWAGA